MQQASRGDNVVAPSQWSYALGAFFLIVYAIVVVVSTLGYWKVRLNYKRPLRTSISSHLPLKDVPHVTLLRPMTGQEPNLYECLLSTFKQDYPKSRLTICLCVPSRSDSAYPFAERLIEQFPDHDAHIFIEDEDPGRPEGFGPNPKIGNLSRAYREAKGDIIWIVDCNVWVNRGTAGRMVDRLMGFGTSGGGRRRRAFKFVHQLPVVVSTGNTGKSLARIREENAATDISVQSPDEPDVFFPSKTQDESFGGRVEETFLSAAHGKMYTAINTASVAPCIVGKSNMFRKSHLDTLTVAENDPLRPFVGVDYFSTTICEDHLLADMLWYRKLPAFLASEDASWGHHGLLHGDPAIQPVCQMTLPAYTSRRARWLRVRKFVVPAATLFEPMTESIMCSALAAWAVTTLPIFTRSLGVPPTWSAFAVLWLLNMVGWITVDWSLYNILQSMRTIEIDEDTPHFATPPEGNRRPFLEWFQAWITREALAFPVWSYAIFGGTRVQWRGKNFYVGLDMWVHAVDK